MKRKNLSSRSVGTFDSKRLIEAAKERAGDRISIELEQLSHGLDGRMLGIQSSISRYATGDKSLSLADVLDGQVRADLPCGQTEQWQRIANKIHKVLGFPLEPELFSNMLFVAHVGSLNDEPMREMAHRILPLFNRSDARGAYHFFSSLRFACDTDCSGVALRARLVMGDLKLDNADDRESLRAYGMRLLQSAAVENLTAEENLSHGKSNGPLFRNVLKVYFEDRALQGYEYDRGRKHSPVAVANALYVLFALVREEVLNANEKVNVAEWRATGRSPLAAESTVGEILTASASYLANQLRDFPKNTKLRYYSSLDSLLFIASELVREFSELDSFWELRSLLYRAIIERRAVRQNLGDADDPKNSLNLALRALAASGVGLDPNQELLQLAAQQNKGGGWAGFCPLYSLGSRRTGEMYFGSDTLTTMFATVALNHDKRWRLGQRGGAANWAVSLYSSGAKAAQIMTRGMPWSQTSGEFKEEAIQKGSA